MIAMNTMIAIVFLRGCRTETVVGFARLRTVTRTRCSAWDAGIPLFALQIRPERIATKSRESDRLSRNRRHARDGQHRQCVGVAQCIGDHRRRNDRPGGTRLSCGDEFRTTSLFAMRA